MRPPRVLVAYATRHESTAEIAAAIADELDRGRLRRHARRGAVASTAWPTSTRR